MKHSTLVTVILASLLILCGCGGKTSAEKDLNFKIYNLTKNFPEFYGDIVFFDAFAFEGTIVILTTPDREFHTGLYEQSKFLNTLWNDSEWKELFKKEMVVRHDHLVKLARSNGMDICWRFVAEKEGDGFDIRLSPDEADLIILNIKKENDAAEDAAQMLSSIIDKINSTLPEDKGHGLSLDNIKLTPHTVIYNFTVDENITSHKKIEAQILELNNQTIDTALDNGISGDSLLLTAAKANVGIVYRFSGNKSKYRQDYDILNANELRELAAQ